MITYFMIIYLVMKLKAFPFCLYKYVKGLLTEGFFWIPSLAGPTTISARQTGGGTSWLFPFVVSLYIHP